MRTLMKVKLDIEASSNAISDGKLPKIMQSMMEKLKPEASYFFPMDGHRTCLMVFDMKDASEIPSIVEPFFQGLKAQVDLYPVMNAEDLMKGLGEFSKS